MIWTSFGHHLGVIWTSSGHHLDIIWTSFGLHLDIIWTAFGHHLRLIEIICDEKVLGGEDPQEAGGFGMPLTTQ